MKLQEAVPLAEAGASCPSQLVFTKSHPQVTLALHAVPQSQTPSAATAVDVATHQSRGHFHPHMSLSRYFLKVESRLDSTCSVSGLGPGLECHRSSG